MGEIQKSIDVYHRLMQKKYRIKIDDSSNPAKNTIFTFEFLPENYHHLAGLHYLTDLPRVSNPQVRKDRFFRQLARGTISESLIMSSIFYHKIAPRIATFGTIEEILASGTGKIIVDFNNKLAGSDISAKYYLFKRDGNPLCGNATYYNLFIGQSPVDQSFFPATYIVEPSTMYLNNQLLLDCSITAI